MVVVVASVVVVVASVVVSAVVSAVASVVVSAGMVTLLMGFELTHPVMRSMDAARSAAVNSFFIYVPPLGAYPDKRILVL